MPDERQEQLVPGMLFLTISHYLSLTTRTSKQNPLSTATLLDQSLQCTLVVQVHEHGQAMET